MSVAPTPVPHKLRRRSLRLRAWDYSQRGIYFVIICSSKMKTFFGKIRNGKMELNEAGRIVQEEWLDTARIRAGLELGVYAIMPNHFHKVFSIMRETRRGVLQYAPTSLAGLRSPSRNVGAIVRGFKAAVTRGLRHLWNHPTASVWQRNYYEHVVRDGKELLRIEQYIWQNPILWEYDGYNPNRKPSKNILAPTGE